MTIKSLRILSRQDWALITSILVPVAFLVGYVCGSSNLFSGTSWIEPTIALLAAIVAGTALLVAMRDARTNRTIDALGKLDELLQEVYKAEDEDLFDRESVISLNLRYMHIIDRLCQGMLTGIYDEELITERLGYLVEARIKKNASIVMSTRKNAKAEAKTLDLSSSLLPYESILEWTKSNRPALYEELNS